MSSPKRSPSRLGRREERDARRDAVGDPFRVDAVTDRFVDAVPSRDPVPGRDGRDARVATVFCVSGGGSGSSGRAKRRRIVRGSDSGPAAALTPGQSWSTMPWAQACTASFVSDDATTASAPVLAAAAGRSRRGRPSPGPVVLIKRWSGGGRDSLPSRPRRAPRRGGGPILHGSRQIGAHRDQLRT